MKDIGWKQAERETRIVRQVRVKTDETDRWKQTRYGESCERQRVTETEEKGRQMRDGSR
jgi:hypothetical protein